MLLNRNTNHFCNNQSMKRDDFFELDTLTPSLYDKFRREQKAREKHKKCVRISKNCIVLAPKDADEKKIIEKYKTTY